MQQDRDGDLWVFGYGSLIWNPGFEYAERRRATLDGYRRSFCLWSYHYRGTPETPGLVLALDDQDGGACGGVAFRVQADQAAATHAYLQERELVSYSYKEVMRTVRLWRDGAPSEETASALCYVIDPNHTQYAGRLPLDRQAAVIARAMGPAGPNREYLENTLAHLRELGVEDPELEEVARLVAATPG